MSPCINKDLNPKYCGDVFCSCYYSAGERTNRYFQQYLDALGDGPSALYVTGSEMFQLERYLAVNETFVTPLYVN